MVDSNASIAFRSKKDLGDGFAPRAVNPDLSEHLQQPKLLSVVDLIRELLSFLYLVLLVRLVQVLSREFDEVAVVVM